ncbi:Phage protein [Sodalis praecaptivus]|uniref:Phage protein n=1 Tax=Sodalis praecaptivus TaxID=1239307 RepID=W0I0K0_9GAMM|nr:hypothetical protein [Sodalis praecaptivus]AHF77948.1 Phage protein [Sodalis praecaptivus]
MKERPIIFRADEVRAILDGRKTQTRRVMKPQPSDDFCPDIAQGDEPTAIDNNGEMYPGKPIFGVPDKYEDQGYKSPYGQPGERLWVRETWQAIHDSTDEWGHVEERTYAPSIPKEKDTYWHTVYQEYFGDENREDRGFPWRPAIHMPREASRITLEITGVRVERLRDISEEDARSEGIIDGGCINCGNPEPCSCDTPNPDARDSFVYLWQSIYGEESWQTNPFVWVIEFKRV